jgi:hypothetical protein
MKNKQKEWHTATKTLLFEGTLHHFSKIKKSQKESQNSRFYLLLLHDE